MTAIFEDVDLSGFRLDDDIPCESVAADEDAVCPYGNPADMIIRSQDWPVDFGLCRQCFEPVRDSAGHRYRIVKWIVR